MKNFLRFVTMLFAVITLSALMAHLLEMPAKMGLSRENYGVVQGIYRGWALLGIAEVGAIVFALAWTILDFNRKDVFPFLLAALICFLISLAIFFIFTWPANQRTLNWTILPLDWNELRSKWEYSHAVRAVLNLIGFSLLIVVLLKRRSRRRF